MTLRIHISMHDDDLHHTTAKKNISGGVAGTENLNVISFRKNAGTGTSINPERINDNLTVLTNDFDGVNQYTEIDLKLRYLISEYRQFGSSDMHGTGRWKIQYFFNGNWIDNTINIPISLLNIWSDWNNLTTPIFTSKIRLVCTTLDGLGASLIKELQMK